MPDPSLRFISWSTNGQRHVVADIRARGWSVAVHNHYRLDGQPHAFLLFTRGSDRGVYIKGEGRTYTEALAAVWHQVLLEEQGPTVCIDLDSQNIVANGVEVHLTPCELAVLRVLVMHPNHVLKYKELSRAALGDGYDITNVRTHVSRLRHKLEHDAHRPRLIVTRARVGYLFRADPSVSIKGPNRG